MRVSFLSIYLLRNPSQVLCNGIGYIVNLSSFSRLLYFIGESLQLDE